MKRSSCLSALLVGLSSLTTLTTASVAFAAPPSSFEQKTPATKPARVAQSKAKAKTVQPADPTPAGGGADPTAAPPVAQAPSEEPAVTAPAEPPPSAITLGSASGAPGVDAPNASAAETVAPPKPRPWAGSGIYFVTGMTTATIFRGQNQYANPTVDQAIWFTPRYAINESFQVRGRIIYNYEFTNSDTTVSKNEPRFSDTTLQLYYRKIPEIATIKPQVFIQATAPTSPEARARTMIVSPGFGFDLSKGWEHVLGGEIKIGGLAAYSHPLYQSTTKVVRGERPYGVQTACAGGSVNCSDSSALDGGILNNSDVIAYRLSAGGTWGKWNPSLFFLGTSAWAYHPKEDAQVAVLGGQKIDVQSTNAQNRKNIRQTTYFAASVAYDLTAWVSPEIGYALGRNSLLTESATYGNPFFDTNQDMRVYVGASVDLDALAQTIQGGKPTVVHEAKKKSPSLAF